MLLLRIVGLLAVIAIGTLALSWVFTGDRRYLRIAWRVFLAALAASLLFLLLLFFEKLLVML